MLTIPRTLPGYLGDQMQMYTCPQVSVIQLKVPAFEYRHKSTFGPTTLVTMTDLGVPKMEKKKNSVSADPEKKPVSTIYSFDSAC